MARVTESTVAPIDLDDDEWYRAELRKPKKGWLQKAEGPYAKEGDRRLVIEWRVGQKGTIADWLGISLGISNATGEPSRLRQLLNAIAEKPKAEKVWFDPDTLEWGYGDDESGPAYAQLAEGMLAMLRGTSKPNSKGEKRFRVSAYKAVKTS